MLKTVQNPNTIFDRLYKAPSVQESQPSQQAKDIYFINKECKFLTFEEREHIITTLKNRNIPLMTALADYRANKLNKDSLKSVLYSIIYPKRYAKKTNENLVPSLVNLESKRLSHGGGPINNSHAAGKKSPSAMSTRRTMNESQAESVNHDFHFLPGRASNRPNENDFKEHKRMESLHQLGGYHRPSFKMSQESTAASHTQSKESKGKLWTSRHQHNPSVSIIKGSTEEYKSHSKKLSEIEKFMQKLEGHAKDSSLILRNITNQVQSPEIHPSVYTLVDTAPSHTAQTLSTLPDNNQKNTPNILITDCLSPTSHTFMNMEDVEESQSSDQTIIRRPQRGRTSDFEAFMKGRLPSSSPIRFNTEDTQVKFVKSIIIPDFTGATTSSSIQNEEDFIDKKNDDTEDAREEQQEEKQEKEEEEIVIIDDEEEEDQEPLDTGRFRDQETPGEEKKYNVFRGFGGISSTADDMLAESPNFKSPEKDIMDKVAVARTQSKEVEVSEFSSQNNINKPDDIHKATLTVVDTEDFGFPGELRRNMEALISSKCDMKKPREECCVSPIMGVVPIEESFHDYSYISSRPVSSNVTPSKVSSNVTPSKLNARSPSPISRGDTRSMMDNSYFSSAKAERYVSISLLKKIFTENGIYAEDIVDEVFRYLSQHTVNKTLFVQILTNYLNQLDVDYGVKTHYIANKIFKICDGNDDKVISYNELGSQLALIAEKRPEKSRARVLYETLDAEKHDFVTKSDIVKALTKTFDEVDEKTEDNNNNINERAQEIFKELDREEKGVIKYWDVMFWKDTEGFEKLYQDLKIGSNTLEALAMKKRAISITVNPLEEKVQGGGGDMFDSPPRIEEESNEGTPMTSPHPEGGQMTSPQPLRSAVPLAQSSKPVYISHFEDFSDSKSPDMETKRDDMKLDSVRATANFIATNEEDDTNLLDDINDSPDRISHRRGEQKDYLVSLPKLNALEASSTEDFNTDDYILESVKIERDYDKKGSMNRTANTRVDSRSGSMNRTGGTIRTSGTDKGSIYYHEDFEFNE